VTTFMLKNVRSGQKGRLRFENEDPFWPYTITIQHIKMANLSEMFTARRNRIENFFRRIICLHIALRSVWPRELAR
jgi:hypothetical protein